MLDSIPQNNGAQPQAAFNRTTPNHSAPRPQTGLSDERAIIRTLIEHPRKLASQLLDKLEVIDFREPSHALIIRSAKECKADKLDTTNANLEATLTAATGKSENRSGLIEAIATLQEIELEEYSEETGKQAQRHADKLADDFAKRITTAPQPERPPVFEFGFTTDNDLDDRLGEIEWLWPGYIPRGFVTAAVGDQDVGKSQIAQSLCDIIIRGNRWPDGQPHEPRPDTKLLWIDTEGSIALLHQRMKQWGMKRGCFILPPDPLQELTIDDELHWMWIEAAIEKFMPPIVVIDALSGAHKSGKENGNDEMKPVMKKLAGLAQKYNIAVIVVHHLNKPIAGVAPYPITIHRLRGASAIPQYCRSILALGSPDVNQPEKRRLDVIKLNLAKKPAPVGYELSDHGPLWGDAPEPPKERRAIDDALDFLEIALKDGPRLSEDVQGEAKAQKIGSNALRDAMKAMKVKPRREGGKDGRWFWHPTTEAHKDGQE